MLAAIWVWHGEDIKALLDGTGVAHRSLKIAEGGKQVRSTTGEKALRPGFGFPRMDGRMKEGDDIKLYSETHKTWISLTQAPASSIRGSVALKGARSGKFCGLSGALLKCDRGSAAGATVELKDAGWGNKVGLVVDGKYCTDHNGNVECDKAALSDIAGWEAFEFVDAGGGKVSLKGGRDNKFCSDQPAGVVCTSAAAGDAEKFEIKPDGPVPVTAQQTANKDEAAILVVKRHGRADPEVELFSPTHGMYLGVDAHGAVGLFSTSPVVLKYERAGYWNAAKGHIRNPSTGKYFSAHGEGLHANAESGSAWETFDVELQSGRETVMPLVRGVNLGNWFVLEKWMAQDLFTDDNEKAFSGECDAIDEEGLMKRLSSSTKRSRMEKHWESWITEDDIAWMASHGLNTVRVPFGYWMTHPEPPFIDGQLKYLVQLFEWCEKRNLWIILDFHGLKGSQNGADTSGNCGACGKKQCGVTKRDFLEAANRRTNLEVIRALLGRFARSPSLLAIGLANEVGGQVDSHKTMDFYQEAYEIIREHSLDVFVILDKTFTPSTHPFTAERNIVTDDHVYYHARFHDKAGPDNDANFAKARDRLLGEKRWPVLVGEWALDAHGHNLNDYSIEEHAEWHKGFAKAQLQAYEQHSMGWVYWSYKTRYKGSTWNYRDTCEKGWLPGCGASFSHITDDWWGTDPCKFAYRTGKIMDRTCSRRLRA